MFGIAQNKKISCDMCDNAQIKWLVLDSLFIS